jgi:hypothetical protein
MEVYHLVPHQDLEENIHQSDPRDLDNTVMTLLVVFPPPMLLVVFLPPVLLVVFPDNLSAYTLDIRYRYYIQFLIGDQ